MRRRVVVIRTMMTVVAVVIECCHACTTKAARNFHKWWIPSIKLRTDKTETSHPIPFSNVCFTNFSSNLILKNNHLWYLFFNGISYSTTISQGFSHVSPGFCEPKRQIPGVWITGSPGRLSCSAVQAIAPCTVASEKNNTSPAPREVGNTGGTYWLMGWLVYFTYIYIYICWMLIYIQ